MRVGFFNRSAATGSGLSFSGRSYVHEDTGSTRWDLMWKKRQASDSWVGKELEAYLTEVAYLEEEQGVNIAKSHEILKRTNKINFKKIVSSSR